MNTFKLRQWRTGEYMQEATETFEGTVKEYFKEHMNRIHQENKFRVINSNVGVSGFFIELSDGLSTRIKCKVELVQEEEETE